MSDDWYSLLLKPCPCCGGKAEINTTSLPDAYSDHEQIECTVCGLAMPVWGDDFKATAVIRWNTREAHEEGKNG